MRVCPEPFTASHRREKSGDQKSKLVYFSPAGTSKKTVEAVAEWLAADYSERRDPGVFL